MIAAIALERNLAATGLTDSLLGAAVGLHLRHRGEIVAGTRQKSKEKMGKMEDGEWRMENYFLHQISILHSQFSILNSSRLEKHP